MSAPVPYYSGYTSNVGNVTYSSVYEGCFANAPQPGFISQPGLYLNSSSCSTFCYTNNPLFVYSGVEGTTCYCSPIISNSYLDPDGFCNFACINDNIHACGGSGQATVYLTSASAYNASNVTNSTTSSNTIVTNTTTGSYITVTNTTTGINITTTNSTSGYKFTSPFNNTNVTNSTSSTSSSSASSSSSVSSTMSSSGSSSSSSSSSSGTPNSHQIGSQLYQYQYCFGEPAVGRALRKMVAFDGTISGCIHVASSLGFIYAGLEYGGECWVGNDPIYGGQIPSSYCNMPCVANPSETCGGSYTLSLFKGIATSATTVPAFTATDGHYWTYERCIGEPQKGRSLEALLIDGGATVQSCLQLASDKGYGYAGLEYGGQCFAGNHRYGGPVPESLCSTPCSANPSEICGNNNVLSFYTVKAQTVKELVVQGTVWRYYSCWGEPQQGRAYPNPIANQDYFLGSVESCLQQGLAQGFTQCGLEYGSECWCGYKAYGGKIDESYCNMPCQGNPSEICGGSRTLGIYYKV